MRHALIALSCLLLPSVAWAADRPGFVEKLAPILVLLAVVSFVLFRLPKVEGVEHSDEFRRRRVLNWLPLGLTYAFLYMGRYNLKVSKFAFEEMQTESGGALMGNAEFGMIFGWGVVIYGLSLLTTLRIMSDYITITYHIIH